MHHALSWQDAVSGLAGLLEPGGVLALGEGGLSARCLPWDVGVGRPGPQRTAGPAAPLDADAREVVLAELGARVGRAQAFLAGEDRAAWNSLLDRTSPVWLGNHRDLALLTARTVHMGTKG